MARTTQRSHRLALANHFLGSEAARKDLQFGDIADYIHLQSWKSRLWSAHCALSLSCAGQDGQNTEQEQKQ